MIPPEQLVGERVRVKKNQRRLGGDKCPGRFGTIVRLHPFLEPEPLFFVRIEPTERAKEREDTFFLSYLIILSQDDN